MDRPTLIKTIEEHIKRALYVTRDVRPDDPTLQRVVVYEQCGDYGIVTTGFFNEIVADMKRAGVIGTAKGGEILFLTEAYWNLMRRKIEKQNTAATAPAAPTASGVGESEGSNGAQS